jgi:hypothetical protein
MALIILIYRIIFASVLAELDERQSIGWTVGVQYPAAVTGSSLLHTVQTDSVSHPGSCPIVTGDKVAGSESDQSLPSSAEVKNDRAITSTVPYISIALCLIN